MCKLCNTNNKPYAPKTKHNRITNRDILNDACMDYLNEIPCTICVKAYSAAQSFRNVLPIDRFILKRLYAFHYQDSDSRKVVRREKNIIEVTIYKKRHHTTVKTICGVKITTNTKTKHTGYEVRVNTSNIGTYPTFQEAVDAKIQYLIDNDMQNALKRYINKIRKYNDNNR